MMKQAVKMILRVTGSFVFILGILFAAWTHSIGWEQLPGLARDIGIGANGSVWVIGTNAVMGGYGIYQWDGRDWRGIDGERSGSMLIRMASRGLSMPLEIFTGEWAIGGNSYPVWQETLGLGPMVQSGLSGPTLVMGGYGIYQWDGRGLERN